MLNFCVFVCVYPEIKDNAEVLVKFHPQFWQDGLWPCCRQAEKQALGCEQYNPLEDSKCLTLICLLSVLHLDFLSLDFVINFMVNNKVINFMVNNNLWKNNYPSNGACNEGGLSRMSTKKLQGTHCFNQPPSNENDGFYPCLTVTIS